MFPSWTFDELHAGLKPLELNTCRASAPPPVLDLSPLEKTYCAFFHIDFFSQLNAHQQLGYLDIAGYRIAMHYFVPAQKTEEDNKGTVLLLHGYYDHLGLYSHPIAHLLKLGYRVLAFDLPGHGLSSGERASIHSFNEYRQVFKAVCRLAKQSCPGPYLAMGQSTGCAIIIDYFLSQQICQADSIFDRVVFFAPLVEPYQWAKSRIAYYLARPFIQRLKRSFTDNSNDPEFLRFLREDDPLQPRHLQVKWVGALNTWIKQIKQYKAVDISPLILQGQRDKTVDWQYNIKFLESHFKNPKVFYLPEAGHHLVNESAPLRAQMFTELERYLT